jgi:hypothetical protein
LLHFEDTPAVAKELEAITKCINELEIEPRSARAQEHPATPVTTANATTPVTPTAPPEAATTRTEETPSTTEPFAFADFTWMNGNARTK